VAHRIGQALCYYLLNDKAQIIVRSTVQKISPDELQTENICMVIQEFNDEIERRIGKYGIGIPVKAPPRDVGNSKEHNRIMYDEYDTIEDDPPPPQEEEAEKPEIADFTPEAYDKFISAEVMLRQGDIMVPAHVVGRKHDAKGNPVGIANNNPLLDTRVYEVEFPDGHTEEYAANMITESIYAEVDPEGNQYLIIDEITGHQKDENAITSEQQWIQNGVNRQMCKTTQGWKLKILWKNGTTTWEWLRNMKESNPIKVAEYAVAQGIDKEPAFADVISKAYP
jgi:hypothetical protein